MKLGSLFDGSGGFCLAGLLCGIEPVWASEIEPYPIRVTTKRMPWVKHYGDISTLNGDKLEPVDIITGGSPCQDMSVAGKRLGLKHESKGDEETTRSGLFMEQIRIIREMRERDRASGRADEHIRPRYMVWENVPGAFSSNKGEDFRAVLEETAKVADKTAFIPRPPKGKWSNSGNIVGNGWSIAWRVFDAQFWGVPQRRNRIYLVADFGGECAGEILFKRDGLQGYFAESGIEGQGIATDIENSVGTASGANEVERTSENTVINYLFENHNQDCRYTQQEDTAPTVMAGYGEGGCNKPFVVTAIENHPADSRVKIDENGKIQTLTSGMGTGGGNVPLVMCLQGSMIGRADKNGPQGDGVNENVAFTLNTIDKHAVSYALRMRAGCDGGGKGALIQEEKSGTLGCNNDQTIFAFEPGIAKRDGSGNRFCEDICPTLRAKMGDNQTAVAYNICSYASNSMKSSNPHSGIYKADKARTLDNNGGNPACNQSGIVVVEGNGSRPSHKGDGYKESDVMYTLNTIEQHAVVYAIDRESYNCGQNYARKMGITEDGINSTLNAQGPSAVAVPTYSMTTGSFMQVNDEKAPTLAARDYKSPPVVNDVSDVPEYIVRRLTPTECCRLQGFADWWTEDLGTAEPTQSEIDEWREIFATHSRITKGKEVIKSDKQIIKWLKNPASDSAEYKMWGNGIALPNALYVMQGIAEAE